MNRYNQMYKITLAVAITLFASASLNATTPATPEIAQQKTAPVSVTTVKANSWSYKGDNGPEKWAGLDAKNILCASGKNQSPVDIDRNKVVNAEPRGIKFNYGRIKPETIAFDGKTVSVNVSPGTALNADGIDFELKRLDIHIPSEHTIDGKHYPMEIQLIHRSQDNHQANVSMMVLPGKPDRALAKLIASLPTRAGESNPLPDNALRTIEMKKKYANYYRYSGSTTSPPCSEGVHWFVMKQALSASKGQFEAFRQAIREDNNRPVQMLNARVILDEL